MADSQPQSGFDVDGAHKAGYSDDEIAQHLAQTRGFDYQGAVKAGYSPGEIIQHLNAVATPTDEANQALAGTGIAVSPPPTPNPIRDKGKTYLIDGSYEGDRPKGVYQNLGEGIKEGVDVPGMLDSAAQAMDRLGDVTSGKTKSPNNLRHPIEFAKRMISGVGGPNLTPSERIARGVGNVAGGAMLGAAAPEATAAAEDMGATAASKVSQSASHVKNAMVVGDELKQAASQTPSDATVATAQRPVSDIHQAAVPELTRRAGSVLDRTAAQLGVDTTGETAISTKAELAGRASKAAGQKLYAQLDQAAAETAGAPGGMFQRYAETVQRLERESLDPSLTAAQGEALTERLNNARAEFEAFKKEMIGRGLSEATIKQADRYWAKGAALDELSRSFLNAEDASGNIKPTARPLDTQIKKLTAPASGRGHILKQALSGDADEVANAAKDARTSIETAKVEKAAAQKSVKSTTESAAAAQKRIDAIRGRQKAILKGAAGTVGLGGLAAAYSGVKSVLSHEQDR